MLYIPLLLGGVVVIIGLGVFYPKVKADLRVWSILSSISLCNRTDGVDTLKESQYLVNIYFQ